MTRRDLLLTTAKLGGMSAAYRLMEEMGLVIKPEKTDLDSLRGQTPKKAKVLILGAGIGGMCAAYELEQLGFECVLLEARHRTGGRCYTIRHGDVVEEPGQRQQCEFEKGNFFNPGPTRVPYWHSTVDYCQKFKVALAPWININEGAYFYQGRPGKLQGQKIKLRDIIADTTGQMAEIIARSAKAGQLDLAASADEKLAVMRYLSVYGFLDKNGKYKGSGRRGPAEFVGAGPGESVEGTPYPLADLATLGSGFSFHFINARDQQMSMLEIVGGVDRLARAFEANLRSPIHFGCEVQEIETGERNTKVKYKDAHGRLSEITADYCICTIPLTVLRKIKSNFDSAATSAVKTVYYANSAKVASEYNRRFWEEDERLFGGITWTDMPINQIIYPSHDFFGKTGVLVNYTLGFSSLTSLPIEKRIEAAHEQIDRVHPQAKADLKSAVTLVWDKVPYNLGAFAMYELTTNGEAHYQTLCKPQGRLYFAGEHASRITSWMAGAIESARFAVKSLAVHAQA